MKKLQCINAMYFYVVFYAESTLGRLSMHAAESGTNTTARSSPLSIHPKTNHEELTRSKSRKQNTFSFGYISVLVGLSSKAVPLLRLFIALKRL
jgi:hypothetical protein